MRAAGHRCKLVLDPNAPVMVGLFVDSLLQLLQRCASFPLGEDDIHVVFSTDCTNYQAWQAVVLFHSAILSGHTGPITQLVSALCLDYGTHRQMSPWWGIGSPDNDSKCAVRLLGISHICMSDLFLGSLCTFALR